MSAYLAQASCANTVRVHSPRTSAYTSVKQPTPQTLHCDHDLITDRLSKQTSDIQSMQHIEERVVDLSLSSPYCMFFASSYGEVDVTAHAGAAKIGAASDISTARLVCKFAVTSRPRCRACCA